VPFPTNPTAVREFLKEDEAAPVAANMILIGKVRWAEPVRLYGTVTYTGSASVTTGTRDFWAILTEGGYLRKDGSIR
jgi:hypothetical protein